ncbi:TetR family transcriptional regulator C-terminal domain-containing protein [Ascidiimonas sp. W6]|uniref:TetR/AcrR family transcriptional regulator n=1 Tax=Ascidiimonas meishanensis TaxID=3128903 RepID=UPI0030EC2521
MAATKKKADSKPDASKIMEAYMQFVLEHEKEPKSVYKLCKEIGIEEAQFYKFFGSIDALKKFIWKHFYSQTLHVIEKDKNYEQYANREKMLAFFFTFFENLTLNRSYILYVLHSHKNMLKNLDQLKGLRVHIKEYATELIDERNADKAFKITQRSPQIFSEGAWLQFLFLLKFWMEDTSSGFEKTDIAIEKSVNTIFDVFDNTPLDSILDFGKFLWKENKA